VRYKSIDPRLFLDNRKRFIQQIKGKSLGLFFGNDMMARTADQCYSYRQDSDLFYLTGINQIDTILLLYPQANDPALREVLFIKKTDEKIKTWEGELLSKEEAKVISGVSNVMWVDQYETLMAQVMSEVKKVYLNLDEAKLHLDPTSRTYRFGQQLRHSYPLHKYKRAQPIMKGLRMIKSEPEIELIQKAIAITTQGFEHVLSMVHPGIWEYQVEAILSGTFLNAGAQGHAFQPIVASGASACILHYINNSRLCADGDLLLLDFGAEYANYAADISRTIPVNGRFTERQKKIYLAVLQILEETKTMMTSGTTLKALNLEVGQMMNHALVDLGLLAKKDIPKPEEKPQPYQRYFMHGVSHHLGLDVHDLSDRSALLSEGMVLTCEPGIYIMEEKIGVRLENDILVGKNGPIDLCSEIPIQVEEIESMMNK
jgi:Xaa-Pro aminopeptidase